MYEINPTNGTFALYELPYSELPNAISAQTLAFHQGKHLKAYVDNLNKLLVDSPLKGRPLTEVICNSEGGIFNNAGQVLNHVMYFDQFSPHPQPMPAEMKTLIERDFGSFETFQTEFSQKGATLFGSGWVWLSANADGHLVITQHANADNPVRHGLCPLLTFDVWEHAYYLDHQNRRPDYLASLWPYIDWQKVASRL